MRDNIKKRATSNAEVTMRPIYILPSIFKFLQNSSVVNLYISSSKLTIRFIYFSNENQKGTTKRVKFITLTKTFLMNIFLKTKKTPKQTPQRASPIKIIILSCSRSFDTLIIAGLPSYPDFSYTVRFEVLGLSILALRMSKA